MVDHNFWTGKKVLITGHTGFKGAWMTLLLKQLGADIVGYALPPESSPNLFQICQLESMIRSRFGDITDGSALAEFLENEQPEIIIHLAAQALVRKSYRAPLETYATNVMGTVNLFEAVRQHPGCRVVLNVTTDKCYENNEAQQAFDENDRLGGYDPYSSSKACSELVTTAYRHSFFNQANSPMIASARAGNIIGGGDWSLDRLIPDILNAHAQNQSVHIRNPQAIRPWQFVLDPLRAYLVLIEKLWNQGQDYSGAWNFGPQAEEIKSVAWIANYFQTHLPGFHWTHDQKEHPYEAQFLSLNCEKAEAQLKWKPTLSLRKSLDWIIAWYQAHQQGEDMQAFTLQQIQDYMRL